MNAAQYGLGLALMIGLTAASGCARDLARASSSAIGCPREAIEVSDISIGWSQMSWVARCNGVDFFCSGESDAGCAPSAMSPPEMRPAGELAVPVPVDASDTAPSKTEATPRTPTAQPAAKADVLADEVPANASLPPDHEDSRPQ